MKHKIPLFLIVFRFFCGFLILGFCIFKPKYTEIICPLLLAFGVLSDIFDGIIARKYNIATKELRIWDSRVDVIFWLSTAAGLIILYPDIIRTAWIMIAILGIMELITHTISYIRFRHEASTHHILSKIFTLFLWAMITSIFINGKIDYLFWITFIVGIISQAEAMAIMLIIPHWKYDVKNIFDALKLRAAEK